MCHLLTYNLKEVERFIVCSATLPIFADPETWVTHCWNWLDQQHKWASWHPLGKEGTYQHTHTKSKRCNKRMAVSLCVCYQVFWRYRWMKSHEPNRQVVLLIYESFFDSDLFKESKSTAHKTSLNDFIHESVWFSSRVQLGSLAHWKERLSLKNDLKFGVYLTQIYWNV